MPKRVAILLKEFILILPIATKVPYENSLDPDETPSNYVSHPGLSCLTLGHYFHQLYMTSKDMYLEIFSRREN